MHEALTAENFQVIWYIWWLRPFLNCGGTLPTQPAAGVHRCENGFGLHWHGRLSCWSGWTEAPEKDGLGGRVEGRGHWVSGPKILNMNWILYLSTLLLSSSRNHFLTAKYLLSQIMCVKCFTHTFWGNVLLSFLKIRIILLRYQSSKRPCLLIFVSSFK